MIYVFLANGFEDMEAIVSIDVLKRTGFEVKTVGIGGEKVVSSGNIIMFADTTVNKISTEDIDAIVLPGGMPGTKNLNSCKEVCDVIKYCFDNNILIGAICAAPMILGGMGLLKNKEACCFPGFESYLKGAYLSNDIVCRSGNIITAKGPGVALDFAFSLVEALCGEEISKNLMSEMQINVLNM